MRQDESGLVGLLQGHGTEKEAQTAAAFEVQLAYSTKFDVAVFLSCLIHHKQESSSPLPHQTRDFTRRRD